MAPLQRRLPLSLLIFRLRGSNIRKLGASVLDLLELLAKILRLARLALDGAVAIDAADQKKSKDSRANPDENVVLIIPVLHVVLPNTIVCIRLVNYNVLALECDRSQLRYRQLRASRHLTMEANESITL